MLIYNLKTDESLTGILLSYTASVRDSGFHVALCIFTSLLSLNQFNFLSLYLRIALGHVNHINIMDQNILVKFSQFLYINFIRHLATKKKCNVNKHVIQRSF